MMTRSHSRQMQRIILFIALRCVRSHGRLSSTHERCSGRASSGGAIHIKKSQFRPSCRLRPSARLSSSHHHAETYHRPGRHCGSRFLGRLSQSSDTAPSPASAHRGCVVRPRRGYLRSPAPSMGHGRVRRSKTARVPHSIRRRISRGHQRSNPQLAVTG